MTWCLPAAAEQRFSRADTLRGALRPERTCYDVTYYHLDLRVDPDSRSLRGSVLIRFTVREAFSRLQVDLDSALTIDRIMLDGTGELHFTREYGAVFVDMPEQIARGTRHDLTLHYGGTPREARRPPWQGGVSWTKDEHGNPWVAVTCEGDGASLWWPNKDHLSDEPDSMLISITVPPGLMDVSNGRLRGTTLLPDGWTRYDWFVGSPINNYDVTMNIGKYAHFADTYVNGDTLTLDYYVMPYNLAKARVQFEQVTPMLRCFERYFGRYPFVRDGYKLVECAHTGMEHQSAVAYGNWYLQGYRGRASSPPGLRFDFIIIHESAHEWWGNSVTAQDMADMWIHESFGAYAEALYVECMFGYPAALDYINAKKPNVGNKEPIIGPYNVNREGSGDMYDKGQLVLHTLRNVIDNDSLWFSLIRGLAEDFRWKVVTANDIFAYVCTKTGTDYGYFFDQYLRHPGLPTLELILTTQGDRKEVRYRWVADVPGFRMPVKISLAPGRWETITPARQWQTAPFTGDAAQVKVAEDLFYINTVVRRTYLDPRLKPREMGLR